MKACPLPKIQIKWMRGHERLDWSSPRIFLSCSRKDSEVGVQRGVRPQIIDLFGSKDNEDLCWYRKTSPVDNVLLIHGENVDRL